MDFIIKGVEKIIKSSHNDNICEKCFDTCHTIYFQRNFKNWTSDNNVIDNFIQDSQLSAHKDVSNVLEWIPYNRFYNIKCITKAIMYRANWIDGYIKYWDDKNQNWKRNNLNKFVNLKYLNTPYNLTLEFTNKV
jgi:hypothetical protein